MKTYKQVESIRCDICEYAQNSTLEWLSFGDTDFCQQHAKEFIAYILKDKTEKDAKDFIKYRKEQNDQSKKDIPDQKN